MNPAGRIVTIYGNMVTAEIDGPIRQNAVTYCLRSDGVRLKSEIIRIRGRLADMQVYELTRGLRVGDAVEVTDELLSLELGPGLLGQIYDGLQNPLPALAAVAGRFMSPGHYLPALDRTRLWDYTPLLKTGDRVLAADATRPGARGDLRAPHHGPLRPAGGVDRRSRGPGGQLRRGPADRRARAGRPHPPGDHGPALAHPRPAVGRHPAAAAGHAAGHQAADRRHVFSR